jgi:cytochrome c oxidase subunit II
VTLIRKMTVFAFAAAISMAGVSHASPVAQPPVIVITASKYKFSPDQVMLKKGQPVTLRFVSTDTTHGFMIRALKLDFDIKSGTSTDVKLTPAATGNFVAICDHYCGSGHGTMKMHVTVVQ